jgi:4-hydroxy-3-methylbut-2-enyl diphosphate reductase
MPETSIFQGSKTGILSMQKPKLSLHLAAPRGFCAGVDRAIQIVEKALERFGAPVYVRHEIVHNRHVVEELERKGAIFVEELDEIPGQFPVVFSAHGVPKVVPAEAERRNLLYLDATCPLVSKVHREAEGHHNVGRHIILIGHAGHPEVIGTIGQLPPGAVTLVETVEDVAKVQLPQIDNLAYITQTTLSVDDTVDIIDALRARFPSLHGPRKEDICYATTNRQMAVKAIAGDCDLVLVIGAPNSSNSRRLVEVARVAGCSNAHLVQKAAEIDWSWFDGVKSVGITAGASAPEILVQDVLDAINQRYDTEMDEHPVTTETIHFKLPRALTA